MNGAPQPPRPDIAFGMNTAVVVSYRKYIHDSESSNDISQDVIERIIKYRETFRGTAKITTWIYSIARNRALDFLKEQARYDSTRSRIESDFQIYL